jgi:hypothetical protein
VSRPTSSAPVRRNIPSYSIVTTKSTPAITLNSQDKYPAELSVKTHYSYTASEISISR